MTGTCTFYYVNYIATYWQSIRRPHVRRELAPSNWLKLDRRDPENAKTQCRSRTEEHSRTRHATQSGLYSYTGSCCRRIYCADRTRCRAAVPTKGAMPGDSTTDRNERDVVTGAIPREGVMINGGVATMDGVLSRDTAGKWAVKDLSVDGVSQADSHCVAAGAHAAIGSTAVVRKDVIGDVGAKASGGTTVTETTAGNDITRGGVAISERMETGAVMCAQGGVGAGSTAGVAIVAQSRGGEIVNQERGVTAKEDIDACVSRKTQYAYKGCMKTIARWVVSTKEADAPNYFDRYGQLNLARFSSTDFEAFLLEKRKNVSVGTLSAYRSAMKDYYRRQDAELPPAYGKRMSNFFSGLKRIEVSALQSGAPRDSGKAPMPFSLYRDLCKATLLRSDGGFANLFLTTQWNLMCRSESVQTFRTEHLSAHDDSVGCVINKSKANQEGKGPKDPRHMYANPQSPETCWITALALYLACRLTQPPGAIFPGSEQKARFGNTLRQLIRDKTGQTHFGTHSIRKGVATFTCSGSTGGPSIASVCLRVGWSLGGVQDRYIRYEAAGDQFLGRVVAGMPLHKAKFATLPPHFRDNHNSSLRTCVAEMFPTLASESSLQSILKLCIASLVRHGEFLREALLRSHPLLATSRFRNKDVIDELAHALVLDKSPWMTATGIPPYVELYRQLQNLQKSVDNLSPVHLEGMSALIEEKGVASDNISKHLLEETITKLLERVGIGQDHPSAQQTAEIAAGGQPVHYYNGKFHLLPQDFEFPKTSPFGAWKLWWFGDKARGYPPLQRIRPHDLAIHGLRKTFLDWSALVKHIGNQAAAAGTKMVPKQLNSRQQKHSELVWVICR